MIRKKLKELDEYIKKIDETRPIEFLETSIKQIEEEIKETSTAQLELADAFHKDLIELIEGYTKKETYESVIISQLYNVIINFSRRAAIEHKAASLGIDRTLYKREMGFLFKGKT
ncbi:MAG: hypothetical protein U9R21_03425 [Candidatus Thermoplasmatota archaeon]|nr:hypothetical protein [Candidatus Thermoplasmatota archaeon]